MLFKFKNLNKCYLNLKKFKYILSNECTNYYYRIG